MRLVYVAITSLAALANGYAAWLNVAGAESVKVVADRVHVSRTWMVPFGALLACGALGLLIGFAAPVVGAAAATGLVLYFVCALGVHLRAGDPRIAAAIFFLLLAMAALVADLGYRLR